MTHDKRRAEAARIRDDAEGRLAEIGKLKTEFIRHAWLFGPTSGMSDSDRKCFEGHLEDLESDLFADEIRDLKSQIETASDIAREDYEDHIANRRKML